MVWTRAVCVVSRQKATVTKLLHMPLTQLATVGPIATALQSERPGAALGDLGLSKEGAHHCSRPKHGLRAYVWPSCAVDIHLERERFTRGGSCLALGTRVLLSLLPVPNSVRSAPPRPAAEQDPPDASLGMPHLRAEVTFMERSRLP